MHGGLELARPRRRKKAIRVAAGALAVAALWLAMPRLRAGFSAVRERAAAALGDWVSPHYTDRLAALTRQNADLHKQLARAQQAQAENDAMRQLLGSSLPEGRWQPARVVARRSDGAVLACTAEAGAAVLDALGRYAGQVVEATGPETCRFAFAGSEEAPCAGLSGTFAGLLERQGDWVLTGLPADCALPAGSVVITPGGCWLGRTAEAPRPDADGLTARSLLTDTADLSGSVFFVKVS